LEYTAQTLCVTQKALEEARNTTIAANAATTQSGIATEAAIRAADQSRIATEVELQPYISIEYIECIPIRFGSMRAGHLDYGVSLRIKVTNNGKSPAVDIIAEIIGHSTSFNFVYWEGDDMQLEVYRPAEPLPSFEEPLILAGEFKIFKFSIKCRQDFVQDQPIQSRLFAGQTVDKKFRLNWLLIHQINIRYKDILCRSADFHKIARGTMDETFDGASSSVVNKGILWFEECPDEEHEHYKSNT